MSGIHKKMWEKKRDYTEVWEESGADALFRCVEVSAEWAILAGAVLFARCGILGIMVRLGAVTEPEGFLETEAVLWICLVAMGVIVHVWAEISGQYRGK